MDLNLNPRYAQNKKIVLAAKEVEKCVHCGFCTAACPTYQLDNNELDSPRGRIYLVKKLLEGSGNAKLSQLHLDRCLSCRSCEPACPSNVKYDKIAAVGREIASKSQRRNLLQRSLRYVLCELISNQYFWKLSNSLALPLIKLFPNKKLQKIFTPVLFNETLPITNHRKTVSVITGCAQAGMMPSTNIALAQILDKLGFNTRFISGSCCGALRSHFGFADKSYSDIKDTLNACAAGIEHGDEAILIAASGCESFLQEYDEKFIDHPYYQELSKKVMGKLTDPASFILAKFKQLEPHLTAKNSQFKIAIHKPCTLTNVIKEANTYHNLLTKAGFTTIELSQAPNCCGSAGIYSILQRNNAIKIRKSLLDSIGSTAATMVATANIGCALHIREKSEVPVHHWLDILAARL